MDFVSRVLPVDWTVAIQGGRGTTGPLAAPPIPRVWAKGFDIVVVQPVLLAPTRRSEELIKRITSAHRGGPPAIVIHCAMHTYRASTNDNLARVPRRDDAPPYQGTQHSGQGGGERSARS